MRTIAQSIALSSIAILAVAMPSACAGGLAPDNGARPGHNGPASELAALEVELNAPGHVVARLGETVRLGDLSVRPVAVVEDSRCPRDVTCVWAGRLIVRVAIGGIAEEARMELGRPFVLPNEERVTLVAAMPPRWHQPPPGLDRDAPYRFAFRRGADLRLIMEEPDR